MKKIALIGTHGVGKTTTAYGIGYRLKQMRYDVDVLYEGARKCPLPISKNATIDSQKWMLGEQLKQESLINPNIDFAICDRSIVDIYVYSLYLNRKFAKSLLPLVIDHMKTFDYIFYIPINDKYFKGDSKRINDKQFQIAIDQEMLRIITNMKFYPNIRIISMQNDDQIVTKIIAHVLSMENYEKN